MHTLLECFAATQVQTRYWSCFYLYWSILYEKHPIKY